jgi:hypothetical protein
MSTPEIKIIISGIIIIIISRKEGILIILKGIIITIILRILTIGMEMISKEFVLSARRKGIKHLNVLPKISKTERKLMLLWYMCKSMVEWKKFQI